MNRERSVLSLSPPGQASSQRSVSEGISTVYRYGIRGNPRSTLASSFERGNTVDRVGLTWITLAHALPSGPLCSHSTSPSALPTITSFAISHRVV